MPRSIVITGAGSGIGKTTALAFLAAGWRVALLGRRLERVQAVAEGQSGALAIACDITGAAAVETAFANVLKEFGRLDVLFNNAGIFTPAAPIDEISLADWQASIDVNLTGSFLCARAAFKTMRTQKPQGGRIINNGSISAQVPRAGAAAYTSSKHAVTGLTKAISLDGRGLGITCGQIDVGNADTDMLAALNQRAKAAGQAQEPVMAVDQVAKAVLHMAELPSEANIQFLTITASKMAFIGRG